MPVDALADFTPMCRHSHCNGALHSPFPRNLASRATSVSTARRKALLRTILETFIRRRLAHHPVRSTWMTKANLDRDAALLLESACGFGIRPLEHVAFAWVDRQQ